MPSLRSRQKSDRRMARARSLGEADALPVSGLPGAGGRHSSAVAQLFSAWGIELPANVVQERRPGEVVGGKWLIRFLWDAMDGEEFLEYLAVNRMTNDRWVRIYASGEVEELPTPSEFAIYPPNASDAQREEISREYRDAWRRYDEALVARGLRPPRGERFRDLPRRQDH
jgi:hypothetical protein